MAKLGKPRTTVDEAYRLLKEKHGDSIEMTNYWAMGERANFKCMVCGNEWDAFASSVLKSGTGCKKCAMRITTKDQTFSIEHVNDYLLQYGCCLNDNEYKNSYSGVNILFSCGHVKNMYFINFAKIPVEENGYKICDKCRRRIYYLEPRALRAKNKLIDFVISSGFKFIEYISGKNTTKSDVVYECVNGHINRKRVSTFYSYPVCGTCSNKYKGASGYKNIKWKGGISDVEATLRNNISEWKNESMKRNDYCCMITGSTTFDLHHLYGFNMIVDEAHSNLGIEWHRKVSEYNPKDFRNLIDEVNRIHYLHPYGACLRDDLHELFHSIYGKGNNTPEQFVEFCFNIEKGIIVIPTINPQII